MNRLDFAGLIAARLCHDLASPVGAIVTGTELLADENDATARSEIGAIIATSAAVLSARLRFYRLLFGAGSDLPIPEGEAREALTDYLARGAKVTVDWSSTPPCTRSIARLLLALAITAADALERGGSIEVSWGVRGWRVLAHGPVTKLAAELRAALEGGEPAAALPPAAIALLAATLASSLGIAITIEEAHDALMFGIH